MQALNILKVGAEAMLKDRMEKVKANGINVRFITGMAYKAIGFPAAESKNLKVSRSTSCAEIAVKPNHDEMKELILDVLSIKPFPIRSDRYSLVIL
jgi:hypothetical protein